MGQMLSANSLMTGLRTGAAGALGGAAGGAAVGALGGPVGAAVGLPVGGTVGFLSCFTYGVMISTKIATSLNKLGISLDNLRKYIAILYNGPTEPSPAPIRPLVFSFVLII